MYIQDKVIYIQDKVIYIQDKVMYIRTYIYIHVYKYIYTKVYLYIHKFLPCGLLIRSFMITPFPTSLRITPIYIHIKISIYKNICMYYTYIHENIYT
jgi:hypothetical protein